ncbi:MAG: 50S ribosomal protein L11 methyltransferase [Fimbriimonadaceae bacterium]|nr:50S ribosomal protein L11 methyltransferase [Fimbriimonadaceae bacterium]
MKAWTEVRATLPDEPEDWSLWAEVFTRHGVDGTVQTDTPPTISGYLAPGREDELGPLRAELESFGAVSVADRLVPEEDWAESWKQFFRPRRVGRRLVVRPSWEDYEAGDGDVVIVLDPGQAFGTGDHPTTRGCLEILESLSPQGLAVADIGCGSGVLSVAAMLLGAKSVVAVDVDPPSVTATLENAVRNGVTVDARQGLGFDPLPNDSTYDLVLSNIISAALMALAPEAARRTRPGGHWVVSGVIESNWPAVREAATRQGFTLETTIQENEWLAASFRR